ncbi:MAG: class I SAM-dependent methyltransferase [Pseudomonadota bacterium]
MKLFTCNVPLTLAELGLSEAELTTLELVTVTADTPPQLTRGYALWHDAHGLALLGAELAQPFRLKTAGLQRRGQGRSALATACGQQRGAVLDMFAGFAVDSLTLAAQGFTVTAIERHPLIWLMAWDYVRRSGMPIALHRGDGLDFMQECVGVPEWRVVYMDPMFPVRRKRALPGLSAQILQDLAGTNAPTNLPELLPQALDVAPRVVVKRRAKDPVLATGDYRPAHQIKGRTVRFDVYLAS